MEDRSIPKDVMEMKFDGGKIYASLPFLDFPLALEAVAEVGTMGANKYERHSWKTVSNTYQRYQDAYYRHMLKHNAGEENDSESGLPHLYHMAWNILALLQLKRENEVTKV